MRTENTATATATTKVYEPKKGEWFFQDAAAETLGIETMVYDNGGITKKCQLSDGRIATARLLKGKDRALVSRVSGGDSAKFQDAIVAISTKIDDKDIVIEDLDQLWFNDYTKIQVMASSINFM